MNTKHLSWRNQEMLGGIKLVVALWMGWAGLGSWALYKDIKLLSRHNMPCHSMRQT